MTQEFTAAQLAALTAWVTQQTNARAYVTSAVQQGVRRLLSTLTGGVFYNQARVDEVAAQVATLVRSAQVAASGMTSSYVDHVLDVYEVPRPRGAVEVPARLRAVDPMVEWRRPAEQYRYARSQDVPEPEAIERAMRRADALAEMDVSLAVRESARQKLVLVDGSGAAEVRGYRRIIHPELSEGGVCGLCIAAADQFYFVEELLPLHLRCKCTVLPVITGLPDPKSVDRQAYKDAVKRAGSTGAAELKKLRYRIDEHGELGPVLVAEDADITPPAEHPPAVQPAA